MRLRQPKPKCRPYVKYSTAAEDKVYIVLLSVQVEFTIQDCQQLRPKTLSRLKQDRLSSREHTRAVLHSLELLDVELSPPTNTYPAANPNLKVYRSYHAGLPYLYDAQTNEARWISFESSPSMTRIILNPDEGGFLAGQSIPISFKRDELHLDYSTLICLAW